MKNLIVYQGKYGATSQYAKWLSEDIQLPAFPAETYDANDLEPTGLLVMGSSVYIGKLQIAKWVNKYSNQLHGRQLVLFVVSGTPLNETEKLRKYVSSSLPVQIVDQCRIFFLPGRLIYNKLSWSDRLMLRIGVMFAGSKKAKEMLTGYDNVKREHLAAIGIEIKKILLQQQEPTNRFLVSPK